MPDAKNAGLRNLRNAPQAPRAPKQTTNGDGRSLGSFADMGEDTEDMAATDSQALTTTEDAGPVAVDVASRRYETDPDFSSNETLTLKLKLGNAMTQEVKDGKAQAGQWILPGFPAMDEVVIVPLALSRPREYRDKNDTSILYCSSPDGQTGVGTPGGDCSECPMAKWTDNPGGRTGFPPKCDQIYSYIVYLPELDKTAAIDFRKTSVYSARYINTVAQSRKLGHFSLVMKSELKQSGRNSWFVPAFDLDESVDEQTLSYARSLFGNK